MMCAFDKLHTIAYSGCTFVRRCRSYHSGKSVALSVQKSNTEQANNGMCKLYENANARMAASLINFANQLKTYCSTLALRTVLIKWCGIFKCHSGQKENGTWSECSSLGIRFIRWRRKYPNNKQKNRPKKKKWKLIPSSFRGPFIVIHSVVYVGHVQIKLSRTKRNHSRYLKMRWSETAWTQQQRECWKIARPVPDATRMAHFHFHIFFKLVGSPQSTDCECIYCER